MGGPGNDKLLARYEVRDQLLGGPNFDRARIDQNKDDADGVENMDFQGSC